MTRREKFLLLVFTFMGAFWLIPQASADIHGHRREATYIWELLSAENGIDVASSTPTSLATLDDLAVADDFTVGGDATVTGTLTAGALVSSTEVVTIGTLTVTNTSALGGAVTMSSTLDVRGNVSDGAGDLTLNDATQITGTLDVDGAVLLDSTLDVRGAVSDGGGDLTLNDATQITGTLDVDGAVVFDSTLDAKGNIADSGGDLTLADATQITGSLDVDGAAVFDSTIGVTGQLTASSNLYVGGTTVLVGVVAVTDNFSVTDDVDIGNDTIIQGALDLQGAASDSLGDFTVNDTCQITGTLDVDSSALFDSTVTVTSTLTASATASVTGALDCGSLVVDDITATEVVYGAASGRLASEAAFAYNATTNGLTVEDINCTGTLAVAGGVALAGAVSVGSLSVGDLPTGRAVYTGAAGLLSSEAAYAYNATLNALTVEDANLTGTLVVASTSDLQGNVADSGGDFTVADACQITGTLDVDAAAVFDSTVSAVGLTDSARTAGRVLYVGTGGAHADEAGFEYNATLNVLDVEDLDLGGTIVVAGASDLQGSVADSGGDLTLADATQITGSLDVDGAVVFDSTLSVAGVTDTNLTVTEIVYAGASGLLSGEAAFAYTAATDTVTAGSLSAAGNVTVGGTLEVSDGSGTSPSVHGATANTGFHFAVDQVGITQGGTTRALFNSAWAAFQTDLWPWVDEAQDLGSATYTWGEIHGVNLLIGGTSTFGANLTTANLTDSALTSGRIVVASTAGLLADDANLAWASNVLTIAGTIGCTDATVSDDLAVTDDASVGGALTVTGAFSAAGITDSNLTSGRVVVAGASGLLGDDAGLLYASASDTLTSGSLFLGAGSVTYPAFAWSADNDGTGTGLYRNAADTVAVAGNGTLVASFDAINGLQIFTAGAATASISPAGALTVDGIVTASKFQSAAGPAQVDSLESAFDDWSLKHNFGLALANTEEIAFSDSGSFHTTKVVGLNAPSGILVVTNGSTLTGQLTTRRVIERHTAGDTLTNVEFNSFHITAGDITLVLPQLTLAGSLTTNGGEFGFICESGTLNIDPQTTDAIYWSGAQPEAGGDHLQGDPGSEINLISYGTGWYCAGGETDTWGVP